jgi:hypothetical protein
MAKVRGCLALLMSRSDLVPVRFTCLPFLRKAGTSLTIPCTSMHPLFCSAQIFQSHENLPWPFEHIKVMDNLLPSSKYNSSMSEYPHPAWPFFGETSAPPVPMPHFASSPRNSPRPWDTYNRNPFQNTASVGPLGPPVSHSGIRFIPFLFERLTGQRGIRG